MVGKKGYMQTLPLPYFQKGDMIEVLIAPNFLGPNLIWRTQILRTNFSGKNCVLLCTSPTQKILYPYSFALYVNEYNEVFLLVKNTCRWGFPTFGGSFLCRNAKKNYRFLEKHCKTIIRPLHKILCHPGEPAIRPREDSSPGLRTVGVWICRNNFVKTQISGGFPPTFEG